MIPHIALALLTADLRLATFDFLFHPALDVALLAGADRERAGRHVLAHRRPGADVCALPHRDRRDELRIAPDERAVFDDGGVLVHAVVVAGDHSGADVHLRPDDRVTEIRKVHRLRA